MLKKSALVLIPVLALFSPIAYFSASGWWSKITSFLPSATSAGAPEELAGAAQVAPQGGAAPLATASSSASLEGAAVRDLTEVLRFDVKPGWIVARWPRVSAGLGQLQLQGYRVPLVTGTAHDDLAGALTYYFNPRQQVQRITFDGTTGDTQKLLHLMTTRYGLARRLTNDPGLFVYEVAGPDGRARSRLWIRPAGVVKSSEPYRRFDVSFALERPEES